MNQKRVNHKGWAMLAGIAVLALSACAGGSSLPASTASSGAAAQQNPATGTRTAQSVTSTIQDHSFEGTAGQYWKQCGTVNASISTAQHEDGSKSLLNGKTSKPEVNGTEGECQQIVIPTGGVIGFWVYEGTNDTISYVDQEADLLSSQSSTAVVKQLFKEATTTGGWVYRSYDVSAYAGQTLWLYFGVKGNGYSSDYVYQYVDNVAWASSTASPPPTSSPTATPTSGPTATPTAAPTATPTGTYPCDDQQFLTYQSEFAAGTITADQFVDVCGTVTSVLPEKKTSSGHHGYFYVQMPSGYDIEIVSNLDAMTTDPPTWPWVAVGDYVYVQGRYYYDSASSQGIDWTENDTSQSWPHVGYVVVNGNLYH